MKRISFDILSTMDVVCRFCDLPVPSRLISSHLLRCHRAESCDYCHDCDRFLSRSNIAKHRRSDGHRSKRARNVYDIAADDGWDIQFDIGDEDVEVGEESDDDQGPIAVVDSESEDSDSDSTQPDDSSGEESVEENIEPVPYHTMPEGAKEWTQTRPGQIWKDPIPFTSFDRDTVTVHEEVSSFQSATVQRLLDAGEEHDEYGLAAAAMLLSMSLSRANVTRILSFFHHKFASLGHPRLIPPSYHLALGMVSAKTPLYKPTSMEVHGISYVRPIDVLCSLIAKAEIAGIDLAASGAFDPSALFHESGPCIPESEQQSIAFMELANHFCEFEAEGFIVLGVGLFVDDYYLGKRTDERTAVRMLTTLDQGRHHGTIAEYDRDDLDVQEFLDRILGPFLRRLQKGIIVKRRGKADLKIVGSLHKVLTDTKERWSMLNMMSFSPIHRCDIPGQYVRNGRQWVGDVLVADVDVHVTPPAPERRLRDYSRVRRVWEHCATVVRARVRGTIDQARKTMRALDLHDSGSLDRTFVMGPDFPLFQNNLPHRLCVDPVHQGGAGRDKDVIDLIARSLPIATAEAVNVALQNMGKHSVLQLPYRVFTIRTPRLEHDRLDHRRKIARCAKLSSQLTENVLQVMPLLFAYPDVREDCAKFMPLIKKLCAYRQHFHKRSVGGTFVVLDPWRDECRRLYIAFLKEFYTVEFGLIDRR